ncbi:LAGLIDADG family homing endonuclease [Clostridium perfringens]|nr:LAGLIDADG family homing endonuclease [Clostridium perfringens]
MQNITKAMQLYDNTFMKTADICKETGVSMQQFCGVLSSRTDISPRIIKALEIYKQGNISLTALSKKVGITRKTLTKYIKEAEITITNPLKKYQYAEDYFEKIDTEQKAYWLGFIYADGSITECDTYMRLEIGIINKEHLVKFAECVGLPADVVKERKTCAKGVEYTSYRISVHSTKMCRDLCKLGATPRKSLTLKFPENLRSDLIRHFIRGYFDGDGCVSHRELPSGNLQVRVNFVGTLDFLQSIQSFYWENHRIKPTKITKKNGQKAYSFEKTGSGAIQMLDSMYNNCSIALERKIKKHLAYQVRND